MPSNQTPNYALNQWERDDRILMDDFNADNAKIDAAIKAEVDARTAADAALQAALAKKGNVWAEFYTYTGNGTYGGDNPCHIPFTKGEPLLVLVFGSSNDDLLLHRGLVQTNNHSNYCHVSWQSSGVFWYDYKDAVYQLNVNGRTYTALMLYKLD